MLKDELDIHVHDEVFWTDRQVVLRYVNSDVHCFKVQCAISDQVQQIWDYTSTKQWHYVGSW